MKRLIVSVLLLFTKISFAKELLFANKTVSAKKIEHFLAQFSSQSFEYNFVVQFKGKVTEDTKALLRAEGIKIYKYIPEDALLVRASFQKLQKIKEITQILGMVPFSSDIKISQNFGALSVFSSGKKVPAFISLLDVDERAFIKAQLEKQSAKILQEYDKSFLVLVDESLLPSLAQLRGVEFIERPKAYTPMAVSFEESGLSKDDPAVNPITPSEPTAVTGFETGTQIMNFQRAWELGLTGEGQIAAMADTGLDSGNISAISNDFAGAIRVGFSFGLGAATWSDPMGHGTHVAGSIVGRGVDSQGQFKGGAYGASFIPQGMWSPILDNLTVPPQLSRMFQAALSEGALVHSNSWGSPRDLGSYDGMSAQVDDFMNKNPEFLVVFAAGNSGVDQNADGVIDSGSISSPGTSKNALTVGASENTVANGGIQKLIRELKTAPKNWPAEPISSSKVSDNENGIAMFSSRGPTKDGRLKPDIVAPGTNILSARSHEAGASTLWGEYSKDYLWCGGTSMATPLASAAAVIARQYAQQMGLRPSAAMIKALLMVSAKDLYPGQYGLGIAQELRTQRPNSDQGYGRVDVARILELKKELLFDQKEGLSTGGVFETQVSVKAGQKVSVILVYTDAPGSPVAGKALVNDLDLEVGIGDQMATLRDSVNNVELIEKTATSDQTVKVKVEGINVPMGVNGKQPFALAVLLN